MKLRTGEPYIYNIQISSFACQPAIYLFLQDRIPPILSLQRTHTIDCVKHFYLQRRPFLSRNRHHQFYYTTFNREIQLRTRWNKIYSFTSSRNILPCTSSIHIFIPINRHISIYYNLITITIFLLWDKTVKLAFNLLSLDILLTNILGWRSYLLT